MLVPQSFKENLKGEKDTAKNAVIKIVKAYRQRLHMGDGISEDSNFLVSPILRFLVRLMS